MTRNQLNNLLRAHVQGGSTAFYFPWAALRLILAFALTALEMAGVPQVAAPASFATPADMAQFFRQLVPGNGYRLDLKVGLTKLIAALVLRYARPVVAMVTPAAPTVSFDSNTRILTAAHALGTAQVEYQQSGGAWQAYAPLNIDNSAHNAGEWQFRTKADTGRNPSAPAGSPAIGAVNVAPPVVNYARTLTVGGISVGYGISLAGNNGDTLDFNDVASQGGNPLTMILQIGGAPVAQVDFDPVYNGQPCRYTHNGQVFTTTFQTTNGLDLA